MKKIKLSRSQGARKALLRNLAISLILEGKIKTTLAKAKAARPFTERLIALASSGHSSAKKRAMALLPNKKAIEKLFTDWGPKFTGRHGGFIRIVHLNHRLGDSAKMALLTFVGLPKSKDQSKKEPDLQKSEDEVEKEHKLQKEKKQTKRADKKENGKKEKGKE